MPEERTPAEKVYDKLSAAPIRHPASARLFADWLLQAGDVVTVTSGNETYPVPVYNMEMTWKGSPIVEVDATGSKERPPLPALARSSYGGSRRQAETDETLAGYSSHFEKTDSQILGVVRANGIVLDEDGEPLIDEHGDYVFDDESNNSVFSQIRQQAGRITLEVTRATGAEQTLSGAIDVQAGKVTQIVEAVGSDGQVTAASIVTAINGDTSSIKLKADHVELVGSTIKISDVIKIQNGVSVVNASGVSATFMDADTLQLRSGGSGSALNTVNPNSVSDVQVIPDGSNGYKLQKKTWGSPNTWTDAGTFSRAATASVTGTWSSGTFTVSATEGTISPSTVETTLYGVEQSAAATKQTTAGMINVPVRVVADGDFETGETVLTETIGVSVGGLLKTQTFTANTGGAVGPGTGYIGFSSVTVSVPDVTLNNPTWERSGSSITYNNKYTVTASNGAEKWQMLYLTTSGLTVSLKTDNEGGTVRARVTCSDSNLTAANIKNGVTIFGVTGTYSGTTVTLSDPVWGTSTTSESNTFTVSASNGESTSQTLYMTGSAGSRTVYLKKDSTTGTQLARYIVTDADLTAGNIRSGVNIFGVTGTYTGEAVTISERITGSGSSTQYSTRNSNVSITGNYHYYLLTVTAGGTTKRIQITQLNGYS